MSKRSPKRASPAAASNDGVDARAALEVRQAANQLIEWIDTWHA
jgi:hypothetical protein